ncbi:hypothetical protein [Psychroserpens sp. SPM9]|uniref:hypothetical protein n=1 Tax=Psychroserpens sp. SPM9 TaxID=2975598 RepID=UPI0021A71F21|nr:hypothetical protein [Psychroserpens sp. SPM9]MDG5492130.1 hypothetical protein [Psychroserpens sp. SPM9]
MNKVLTLVSIISFLFVMTSCSTDASETNASLNGTWRLINYDIGFTADINKDDIKNQNILDEIDCEVNETLTIEANNTMTSYDTFHHDINISKSVSDGDYNFEVFCSEGYISSSEVLDSSQRNALETSINGNTLTRVFENAIEIYNEDFSAIVAFENLTLVYEKL